MLDYGKTKRIGLEMFERCSFIMGEDDSIIVVVPQSLPKELPLTLEVHNESISFLSGDRVVANVHCTRQDVIARLLSKAKVGLIEFINGKPSFPAYISTVADVQRGVQAA